mmetsp:Transcript_80763/g.127569  ORF Transcript_80763/g.127569 Transcript_80763/m.127569 type:complete len:174 (+) Transcript_80763:29-550(+)
MDALALLSDDDDDVDDEEDLDLEGSSEVKVDFGSLQRAGYQGNQSLSETDMYKRAGEVAPPPPAAVPPMEGAVIEKVPQLDPDVTQVAEDLKTLEKAKLRDRKRAGVQDGESNRKKNARKMKMGQATFSLKDDRDCVNPFIDQSDASHVKGYSGKRVDKRASVKQISNLDFTS